MLPSKFEYIKATSVKEALSLLDKHGSEAQLLSGGHSLLPTMKIRLNNPAIVVDIGGINGLNTITEEGNEIVIGANCTHSQIAASDIINSDLNILAQTAKVIGDLQVRNRGTIGGSLAHADPAADYPATVLATEAKINVESSNGSRTIDAKDFFQGLFTTALADNEMITAVRFPKTNNGVYLKFHQAASRFAVVGCAAVKTSEGVRIGMTGVASSDYRAEGVESAYNGDVSSAAEHAVDGVDVMGDHFASSEYRAHLAKVFVGRALSALN